MVANELEAAAVIIQLSSELQSVLHRRVDQFEVHACALRLTSRVDLSGLLVFEIVVPEVVHSLRKPLEEVLLFRGGVVDDERAHGAVFDEDVAAVNVDVDVQGRVGAEVGVGECEFSVPGVLQEGYWVHVVRITREKFGVVDLLSVDSCHEVR